MTVSKFPSCRSEWLALALVLFVSLFLAPEASADTLTLTPEAAQACPACTTPTGGSEAVNLFATIAPQDIELEPGDGAGAPAEGWEPAADRMAAEAETLDSAAAEGSSAAAE